MKYNIYIKYALVLGLLLIQLLFLIAIFNENSWTAALPFTIIILSLLLGWAYFKLPLHQPTFEYDNYKICIWIPIAACSCYYLNNHLGLGPALAASSIGLAGSFIPNLPLNYKFIKGAAAAIYCGAFIGMTGDQVAHGFAFIGAASVFASLLLIVSKSLLDGMGGKLGTIAFAAVCITSFIFYIISR